MFFCFSCTTLEADNIKKELSFFNVKYRKSRPLRQRIKTFTEVFNI